MIYIAASPVADSGYGNIHDVAGAVEVFLKQKRNLASASAFASASTLASAAI